MGLACLLRASVVVPIVIPKGFRPVRVMYRTRGRSEKLFGIHGAASDGAKVYWAMKGEQVPNCIVWTANEQMYVDVVLGETRL